MKAVVALSASNVLALYGTGGSLRTTDAGKTWPAGPTPPPTIVLGISADVSGIMYAVGEAGGIARSTDNGATWTTITTGTDRIVQVVATSVNIAFAVQESSIIQTTGKLILEHKECTGSSPQCLHTHSGHPSGKPRPTISPLPPGNCLCRRRADLGYRTASRRLPSEWHLGRGRLCLGCRGQRTHLLQQRRWCHLERPILGGPRE